MGETAGLYEFVGIGELAETTTRLLALSLHQTELSGGAARDVSQVEQLVLQQARDYVRKVREGFMLSVRAGQITQRGELRYLLDRVLSDWTQLSRELGLEDLVGDSAEVGPDADAPGKVERVRHQLLAFGMAVVALGALPRLPAKQITFPHSYGKPPTYSDIPVPHTPGELLHRIEEMEQMVWRLMSDNLQALVQRRYGPLRRTYGFFEASAWLTRKDTARFGAKARRSSFGHFSA